MLDFVSSVENVTFLPVSEADFTSPYESCGSFLILNDKLAFEGEEGFVVNLLSPPEDEYRIGQNGTANVTILDDDGKRLAFLKRVARFSQKITGSALG